ncbi:MAG: hypothetical protein IJI19_08095 [Ruminococcus sp.]|nr:hypothetical protein [Ruminococcus sp.]
MKKTFTKIISLVLALLMVGALLAACGGSSDNTSSKADDSSSAAEADTKTDTGKKAKIGVLVSDVSGEEAQGFRK